MDVALHWHEEWPAFLRPLWEALEDLPGVAGAPEGRVVLCPDAAAVRPPAETSALVALVPRPERLMASNARPELRSRLGDWTGRGAILLTTTTTAAIELRRELEVSEERVRVLSLPLPAELGLPAWTPGADILALAPVVFPALLPAVHMLRTAGFFPRVRIADPKGGPFAQPGNVSAAFSLHGGYEVTLVEDWRSQGSGVGAIVHSFIDPGLGWQLRQALSTGVPVVAPSSPSLTDHLGAIGASAYMYAAATELRTLYTALAAALRGDRGEALGRGARAAVLGESWVPAAETLFAALCDALAPARQRAGTAAPPDVAAQAGTQAVAARRPRVEVTAQPLRVCVMNPNPSGGGGERFMRQLVSAIGRHASSPAVKLVCQVDSHAVFEAGAQILERAGVKTITVGRGEFEATAEREAQDADVVYYTWPHRADPLKTSAPLVCTFHDLNWKHFDVISDADKALIERQTPQWIARSSAMVHSSEFIRGEMLEHYGPPPSLLHVIPIAPTPPPAPPSAAEREHVRRRFALPDRFLLSPNGNHYHKNYPALMAALRLLRADGRPVKVVASGMATELFHEPDLHGLGYISARELQALYAECAGVVQTTLYEAGSFPMAEALIAGRPVAISRVPPIVEQVERQRAVVELFDPLDPSEIAEAIWRLWSGSEATQPETLAANARGAAARTWDDVAGEYLDLFASLPAQ